MVGFSLPDGYGLGDVGNLCYKVTARDSGVGEFFVGGCFPDTQLINQVGAYCMDLEVDNVGSGLEFTTDATNGWSGTININGFIMQMKQDN
jgi:hypothetical protein